MNQPNIQFGIFIFLAIVGVSFVFGQCILDPACDPTNSPNLLTRGPAGLDAVKRCLLSQTESMRDALADWTDGGGKLNKNKYNPGMIFTWGPKVKIESWGSKANGFGVYDTTKWTHVYDTTSGFQMGRESYSAATIIYGGVENEVHDQHHVPKRPPVDNLPFDPYNFNNDQGYKIISDADAIGRNTFDLQELSDAALGSNSVKFLIAAFDKVYPEASSLVMHRGFIAPKSYWSPQFFEAFKTGMKVGSTSHGFDSSAGLGLYFALHPEESTEHGGVESKLVRCFLDDQHTPTINIDAADPANTCRIENLVTAHILIPPDYTLRAYPLLRPNKKNMWFNPGVLEKAASDLGLLIAFRAGALNMNPDRPPFVVDKRAIDFSQDCKVVLPALPYAALETNAETTSTITPAVLLEKTETEVVKPLSAVPTRKLRLKIPPPSSILN